MQALQWLIWDTNRGCVSQLPIITEWGDFILILLEFFATKRGNIVSGV